MGQPPLAIIFTLAFVALLSAFLAAHAIFRRRQRGAFEFGLMVLGTAFYAMGYLVELSRSELAEMLLAVKIEYIGIAYITTLALLFALRLTRERPPAKGLIAALLAVPTLTLVLAWTLEHHSLLYIAPHVDLGPRFPVLAFGRGPWYLFNFIYQLGISFASIAIVLSYALRAGRKERRRALVVAAGSTLPFFAASARLLGLVPPEIDPAPMAFSGTTLVYAFALYRLGLFELVPVARELALDSIREGFIVVDQRARVQDMNAAARRLPGALHFREGEPLPSDSALASELGRLVGVEGGEREFTLETTGEEPRSFLARAYALREKRASGTAYLISDVTERARFLERLRRLAETDVLTGLLSRRRILELALRETDLSSRTGRPFGLLMVDLDHFKRVNDSFGHAAGDEALKQSAERFTAQLRAVDLAGRYGGEEFLIVLPEADLEASVFVAERLRSALAATPLGFNGLSVELTARIGVHAGVAASKDDFEEFLRRADKALYKAKAAGRNRVESWENPPSTPEAEPPQARQPL
jgi:diguanylate cyclase (GGDEF)-like protein